MAISLTDFSEYALSETSKTGDEICLLTRVCQAHQGQPEFAALVLSMQLPDVHSLAIKTFHEQIADKISFFQESTKHKKKKITSDG